MSRWRKTVNVSDIFHNEDLTFEQRRDGIVRQFRRFWPEGCDDFDIDMLLEELADAENADDFDMTWDMIYGWADDNRVWVKTV